MSTKQSAPGATGAQRDQRASGSTTTVPNAPAAAQQTRPLQAAAGTGRILHAVPPDPMPGDITALRAETQIAALRVENWPTYGTAAWLNLPPQDPRAYAATLEAAELHRRSEAAQRRLDDLMENDPVGWWREITADANAYAAHQGYVIAARRTAEEIRVARDNANNRAPHQLRASPGWPPIAIPGQPGRYLTHGQENSA